MVLFLVALIVPTTLYSSPTVGLAGQSIPEYQGILYDSHCHQLEYLQSGWIDEIRQIYKAFNIQKAIILDSSHNLALDWYKRYPDFVVPSFYVGPNKMADPVTVNEVSEGLADGFQWVGEALLRHSGVPTEVPADHPTAIAVYQACTVYNVPIMVHHDNGINPDAYQELENALSQVPNAMIILHGWGWDDWHTNAPMHMRKLLNKYPNLYIEISGLALPFTHKRVLRNIQSLLRSMNPSHISCN